MAQLVDLFVQFFWIACVSFGGVAAILPELHRVVVEQRQWMDDATFSQLFAIAQAAPGPNLLVMSLIGWQVAGFAGAVVATLAIVLPMAVVVFFVYRYWQRFEHALWRNAIQLGVAPLAVGLVVSSGCLIGLSAGFGRGGVVMALVSMVVMLRTRLHPLWMIGLGALVGALGGV